MILIRRPTTEPPALAKQRRAGLARAFAALNKHGADSEELKATLTHYDGGKAALYKAQRKKCAYCERRVGFKANALEHVRPRKEVWRHLPGTSPPIVEPGYWWLTWTWANQLFACTSCNTGHKQNYFPLAVGSGVLAGPASPYPTGRLRRAHVDTSVESPLFIDPSVDDPLDHIEWRPINRSQPKRLWKWSPAPLTSRGQATIQVLHLSELADDVGDHVRDNVLARAESVCGHIDCGQHRHAGVEWDDLMADVARSDCYLAGPTWNALVYLVEQPRRTAANLSLPQRP